MAFSTLWQSPAVNPMNGKALSVPALNPIDKYGRTLYASTIGFMVAFLSWYAFPPLVSAGKSAMRINEELTSVS